MRPSMARTRISLVALAAVLVAGCTGTSAPTPIPPISQPPDPFKAPLQPLGVGTTWYYATSGQPDAYAVVNTVLEDELIGEHQARWLQLDFGERSTVRVACIVQDGAVYAVAFERPGGPEGWQREVLAEPQLFRPGPEAQTWAPTPLDLGTTISGWTQTDSGRRDVLGTQRQTWTSERRYRTTTEEVLEKEVRAEGLGLVQRVVSAPNGANATTFDLIGLRQEPWPMEGIWAGTGPGTEGNPGIWGINFASQRVFVTPLGNVAIADWTAQQDAVAFSAQLQGSPFTWAGRIKPPGLTGIATYQDQKFVLEFRVRPEIPAATPSPAAGG
jgi:hypothetical protein